MKDRGGGFWAGRTFGVLEILGEAVRDCFFRDGEVRQVDEGKHLSRLFQFWHDVAEKSFINNFPFTRRPRLYRHPDATLDLIWPSRIDALEVETPLAEVGFAESEWCSRATYVCLISTIVMSCLPPLRTGTMPSSELFALWTKATLRRSPENSSSSLSFCPTTGANAPSMQPRRCCYDGSSRT